MERLGKSGKLEAILGMQRKKCANLDFPLSQHQSLRPNFYKKDWYRSYTPSFSRVILTQVLMVFSACRSHVQRKRVEGQLRDRYSLFPRGAKKRAITSEVSLRNLIIRRPHHIPTDAVK